MSLNARDTATLKEIINCQREILAKNCDKLPQDKKRNKEVKHLSQKLLEQFNKENENRMKNCENSPLLKHNRYLMAPMGEDMYREGSTHESDTSSMADERDIHFNLKKIHNFLESQDRSKLEQLKNCDHLRTEEEFNEIHEGLMQENKQEKDI